MYQKRTIVYQKRGFLFISNDDVCSADCNYTLADAPIIYSRAAAD